jgi:hypothetical integral membrane protein (TIGR02206 family)
MDASSAPAAFHAYEPAHLVVLGTVVVFTTALIWLTRAGREAWVRPLEIALAVALFLTWPINLWVVWQMGWLSLSGSLPLQLCDAAAILGGAALLWRKPLVCELLYFWGLAGTLQGLITPNLDVTWPHPRFISFFLLHGGVVAAAFQIVVGRRMAPRPGAVWRVMAWLVVYGAIAGTADAIIFYGLKEQDVNYGFLCAKPAVRSLLDALGSWPWYLFGLAGVALVFFSVLNLPFVLGRRGSKA